MSKRITPLSPHADRSLRRQVESLKRQKLRESKVVSLDEFRGLKKNVETKTILVVDDEEIMRNALKRILEAEGYKVLLAGDGLELSKTLETTKLDMVLLDINLPWVDGYELCRLIKGHSLLKQTPVIMCSARKTKEEIDKGFEAGADDFITKPFDIDMMTKVISEHFLKRTS